MQTPGCASDTRIRPSPADTYNCASIRAEEAEAASRTYCVNVTGRHYCDIIDLNRGSNAIAELFMCVTGVTILFSAKTCRQYFAALLLHISVDGRSSVAVRIQQAARLSELSELSASPHKLRYRHQRLPLFSRIQSTFAASLLFLSVIRAISSGIYGLKPIPHNYFVQRGPELFLSTRFFA